MQTLVDYIKYYVSLTLEAEEAVIDAFKFKRYTRNQLLHREGETCRNLYFLLSGTVRTFYSHEGKDVTTWIYPDGFFITSWTSFLLEKASFESIEAVQDAEVAFITKPTLYTLYDKYRGLERFGRYLAEEQLAAVDQYSKGYYLLTAKQKYDNLLSFFPDIEQRANLGHIASMLGVSQETLSRIRAGKL